MSEQPRSKVSREERLAVQLRANLRRRKAQARAMHDEDRDSPAQTLPKPATDS